MAFYLETKQGTASANADDTRVIGVAQVQLNSGGAIIPTVSLSAITATNAFNTTAGARQLAFSVTGTSNVTIAGGTFPPGTSFAVSAPSGTTINAVSYNAVNSAIIITTLL